MKPAAFITSRWAWLFTQLTRRIWVRASLFCVLAIVTAFLGVVFSPYIPDDLQTRIGADAVDRILGILAASMLSVTTFSLGIMVSAYSAATSNVTPRATRLIMQDPTTQNVLSTFIGSFLYSLVSIVVLTTGAYGGHGRVILFVVTICVIILIIVTLLRWIDHLSHLGHVTETTAEVERATCAAMRHWKQHPHGGCRVLTDITALAKPHHPVMAAAIGYVQHIDVQALSKAAKAGSVRVFVAALPGHFVDPSQALLWTDATIPDKDKNAFRQCFTIGDARSFDQDPRFGLSVLAEIASRALSPGLNDPGTAIDVIGRSVRILALWAEPVDGEDKVLYPEVYLPAFDDADLFDDIYTPIARDGAAMVEIGVRLQKAYRALSPVADGRYVRETTRHSTLTLTRCEQALTLKADIKAVRVLAKAVLG